MFDGLQSFAFVVATATALVFGFDALFNDSQWMVTVLHELGIKNRYAA